MNSTCAKLFHNCRKRLMGASAKVEQQDEPLFAALAKTAKPRISELNAEELAITAWAFTKAEQQDAALFAALLDAVKQRHDE